jgi:hypothetical protein
MPARGRGLPHDYDVHGPHDEDDQQSKTNVSQLQHRIIVTVRA